MAFPLEGPTIQAQCRDSLVVRILGYSAVAKAGWSAPERATAMASSPRRTSKNVTGTAARPTAAHTQSAEWNPPVRAADCAPPPCSKAPLHQPKSLDALAAARSRLPDAVHVACFDTAFHATLPEPAATYALPREWIAKYGLRRYGFHGLSHAWASRRAAELVPAARRIVTCQLGAGASLCAVRDGLSVDTTTGFTPLEGLVMATRSGDVDPGLLMWLSTREPDLADALEHRSGLAGLADNGDMRALLGRSDHDAQLAVEVYLHRLRKGIAAMAGCLGGLDSLVFTGGVGENSAEIRQRAIEGLEFLGLAIDPFANAAPVGDTDVSHPGAQARTLVIGGEGFTERGRRVPLNRTGQDTVLRQICSRA